MTSTMPAASSADATLTTRSGTETLTAGSLVLTTGRASALPAPARVAPGLQHAETGADAT